MTTIYFAGQNNFGNRGCEALIRSNVKAINQHMVGTVFLVPSINIEQDANQWKDAGKNGVTFIPAEPFPLVIRRWIWIARFWRGVRKIIPKYQVTDSTVNAIASCDAMVMTGGDIISFDYGLGSLYYWMGICEAAMDAGKPTVLWAASVGPFSSSPKLEAKMKEFLNRFSLITVRETTSLKYLMGLGIKKLELVIDPAFSLDFESAPSSAIALIQGDKPILGFNVSPLLRKFRDTENAKNELDKDLTDFLINVLKKLSFKVLLIPHVDPLDGSTENSDSAYMCKLLEKVRQAGFKADQIEILPRTLNAAQLKDVIRQCTYFMGARTHATIASLSQGVPTTSIAYSVKAKGINQDLFGHVRYVQEAQDITSASLMNHLNILINEATEIREHLRVYMPEWEKKLR